MKRIILLASIIAIVFIVFNMRLPPEPAEFVNNKTVGSFSTIFFDYEIFRYPSNVEIKRVDTTKENITLGFATEPWNINFGAIPGNGTFVQRNIVLSNPKSKDFRVILKAYGNVSGMISFSKNDFVLKPNEKASIDISLNSSNMELGNYSGEIDVIVQKAIYNFSP
jgi:hypothetical protein